MKPISSPLPPPDGYATWLDYAVNGMDTRSLYHELCVLGRSDISRDAMRAAVEQELRDLRAAAGVADTYQKQRGSMILYLDFDGVLHDSSVSTERDGDGTLRPSLRVPGEFFMWAHFLSDALVPFPDIQIILSTRWVWWFGLPFCRAALPTSLAARVVGATWEGEDSMPEGWINWDRARQVRFHAERHGITNWFGIDDDMQGMKKQDRDLFVLTKPWIGLSEPSVLEQVEAMLSGHDARRQRDLERESPA